MTLSAILTHFMQTNMLELQPELCILLFPPLSALPAIQLVFIRPILSQSTQNLPNLIKTRPLCLLDEHIVPSPRHTGLIPALAEPQPSLAMIQKFDV